MKISTNFYLLARSITPPHKRQPVRMAILSAFLHLEGLLNNFFTWRLEMNMLINVNSQVKVLEGFLRTKYNNRGILLKFHEDSLLRIGLMSEGDTHVLPLASNATANIPLLGENTSDLDDADFMVLIPGSVPRDSIQSEIEKYKLAEKSYKIIQA